MEKEEKVSKRRNLHLKYSVNPKGFENWIQERIDIHDGYRILELGCSTGALWYEHKDRIKNGTKLYLTDFSENILDCCKKSFEKRDDIILDKVDIQNIPYEDKSFDIVIANMMLYHVRNINQALKEVRRVLKADGKFYCTTYGEHGTSEFLAKVLMSLGVDNNLNKRFTLQNGLETLKEYFSNITQEKYEDSLAITNVDDFVDYIYTFSTMTNLQPEDYFEVKRILEARQVDGVLKVPKEYGMFICC